MTDKKEEEKIYKLVQVPTEFGLAVQTPEGEQISPNDLLVKMANTLDELKKGIVG